MSHVWVYILKRPGGLLDLESWVNEGKENTSNAFLITGEQVLPHHVYCLFSTHTKIQSTLVCDSVKTWLMLGEKKAGITWKTTLVAQLLRCVG